MARRAMFTREIVSLVAVCSVFDMSTATMSSAEFYTDESIPAKALADVRESNETESLKILAVNEVKEVRKMYGMYVEDFVKAAIELDPDTRKPLEK